MFSVLAIITGVFALLYIGYVVFEYFYCNSLRKKLKTVIHVNGIRGKSTVTRLIAQGLKSVGYKVYAKSTGTVPCTIDVDGVESPIKRLGPANIREQIKIMRKAVLDGADVLVIECMAVNPELQYITEHKMLKSNITVITNVRPDHLDEMGDDLTSIAYSLANTVPHNGVLVLGENKIVEPFYKVCEKENAKLYIADEYLGDSLDTFSENIGVSLKVAEVLGVDKELFLQGLKDYKRDPGALSEITFNNSTLINGFSINDPESTLMVYDNICKKYDVDDITVLLNVRLDRPKRAEQHIQMLANMKCKKIMLVGSYKDFLLKKLHEHGITAYPLNSYKELLDEKFIFGCGNIANDGMKIIDYYKKGNCDG